MPAVEDILADLATHPPAEPTPVTAIRGRARRRAQRRRVLVGAAAVLVVAVAAVGVGAAVTADGPDEQVRAEGGATSSTDEPTTASSTPPGTDAGSVPIAGDEPTMTLDPASGYVDGTVVEMALDEPATGPAWVAQCAAESGTVEPAAVGPWCRGIVESRADDLQPFTLARTIETPAGVVDCAVAVGRCTLGVRVGGASASDDRFAPLAFRDDLPPPVEPAAVVDGDEGTVGDGDALLVTLTGVATGEAVRVYQCLVEDPGAGQEGRRCSSSRSVSAVVQDGPETQLTLTAFHDVLVDLGTGDAYAPHWTACAPCVLVVEIGSRSGPIAVLPMDMEPTETPIRPSVAIEPGGPVAPGSTVTVRAAGLQPGTRVPVGWCPANRAQGGGDPPCDAPPHEAGAADAGALVGDDGTFVVTTFPLPAAGVAVHGEDCAVPGTCGIGLDAGDSFSIMAFAPLDLSG